MGATLKIERLTNHAYFTNADRSVVDAIYEGDLESRAHLLEHDYEEISETDYWLIKLRLAREERDYALIVQALDDFTDVTEVPL